MLVASSWRSAARTDAGKVRARNEDAFLDRPQQGLWVVADGMGGHHRGDVASQLIVASFAQMSMQDSFEGRLKEVRQCLHWLNRRMGRELTVTAARSDNIMGSTVVVLLVEGDRAACIWAGDSRCYLWRGERLYQLSKDHSLQQQLIDEQQMSVEDARAHPAAHALTRAVGAAEQLTLEVLELKVYPGDTFLLCSDGLYQEVGSDEMGRALSLPAPARALERLFEGALRGAARDNLTAIVVRQ
ncbi:protein phosphatase (plasmid) [Pseudomonas frederiksbergensis]|uniref:Protein phosphatase n=1 Tax=Pseudomonas frederiksbergensis TaxID=104087 RepID=A0A1J0EUU6_9PSED|nr:PP2C family serine/threonine-protein phosphatase [Pseudomonas frederiksbergensis]APC19556.1 protein phosphatase [Pseudomonas frederiksbergensis]